MTDCEIVSCVNKDLFSEMINRKTNDSQQALSDNNYFYKDI